MTESDQLTIAQLRAAMSDEVRGHHLDPGRVAAAALAGEPPRPTRRVRLVAVAAGLVVAAAIAAGYLILRPDPRSAAPPASASCPDAVVTSALPTWARSGFSDRVPVMPHVLSAKGHIVAILWADPPLYAPPRRQQSNKILWVARDPSAAPLVIRARLAGSDVTVTRRAAVGPSIIDVPQAGCWTFALSWSGHHDTLRLPYVSPSARPR